MCVCVYTHAFNIYVVLLMNNKYTSIIILQIHKTLKMKINKIKEKKDHSDMNWLNIIFSLGASAIYY